MNVAFLAFLLFPVVFTGRLPSVAVGTARMVTVHRALSLK
jgi:hypothetical protein